MWLPAFLSLSAAAALALWLCSAFLLFSILRLRATWLRNHLSGRSPTFPPSDPLRLLPPPCSALSPAPYSFCPSSTVNSPPPHVAPSSRGASSEPAPAPLQQISPQAPSPDSCVGPAGSTTRGEWGGACCGTPAGCSSPFAARKDPAGNAHAVPSSAPTSSSSAASVNPVSVGLVISHPDDESMFFSPTLSALHAHSSSYSLSVLCLSSGNALGLGATRTLELQSACSLFDIPPERIHVVDHPDLQDGFDSPGWSAGSILPFLQGFVGQHSIRILLSFDPQGVSGHPNHRNTCLGVRHFLRHSAQPPLPPTLQESASSSTGVWQHLQQREGPNPPVPAPAPVTLWELQSDPLTFKFLGPLGALCRLLLLHLLPLPPSAPSPCGGARQAEARRDVSLAERAFFLPSCLTCLRAMRLHRTQWVWFRCLFVAFATFPYTNRLRRWGAEGPSSCPPAKAKQA